MDRGKLVENRDEFVKERLALQAEEEMLEIIIGEVRRPAAVGPELHCRNVRIFNVQIFVSHTILDCRMRQMERT